MVQRSHSAGLISTTLFLALAVAGCTGNEASRTEPPAACQGIACDHTIIEQHPKFDLAYVEFTERGNVFDRARMATVLDDIRRQADSPEGVTAVVFVHGWKHNASAGDTNVDDFRMLLDSVTSNPRLLESVTGEASPSRRRLVGIYVGWRGLSVTPQLIKELSYWERKAAAEQVGKGGVTELILQLERAVVLDGTPNKNLFLVVGHSFGGAIVLSALNQILLERVVAAQPADDCAETGSCACVETRPFGHGVVLLNPAIEANQALQLKQVVSQKCFAPNQVRLMHVISSDADRATNKAFRVGQTLDMLGWREDDLDWQVDGQNRQLFESELDTITVGNFTPFQTGQLCDASLAPKARRPECRLDRRPERCLETSSNRRWDYISYVGDKECVPEADRAQHIPVGSNEPLAFIQTDDAFIEDHNDVFNNNVIAYLAAIMAEARFKRARHHESVEDERFQPGCTTADHEFEFGPCFETYQKLFPDE